MNWYKYSQHTDLDLEEELDAFLQSLRDEFPLQQLEAWIPHGRYIEVANIKVRPDSRDQGVGTEVMRRIQEFAKQKNMPITLRPSPEKGKKKALERFYRNLGFSHNRGRYMDYELSSPTSPTMYWKPE